ncbi:MAG: 2-phospho-L-lactate guanylyltransferase [Actinomycetota bacterium]
MSTSTSARFVALIPVKPTATAKSRLAAVGDAARRSLVAAFVADTVSAAASSPLVEAVLVITDDHVLAVELASLGASVIPDATTEDLNESLVQAAAEARRRWPALRPVALCADLPAMRTEELTGALAVAVEHDTAFVADSDGSGTTLLAARDLDSFVPRFGAGSREAHLLEGAHEVVEIDVPTLRRDVDTPADLAAALRLGVGARTIEATRGLRL